MYNNNSGRVDISVRKTLKKMKKLIILGWVLYILGSITLATSIASLVDAATFLPFNIIDRFLYSATSIGIIFFNIAAIVVGIQLIRKNNTFHGVLLILFGGLTLGIWPFIASMSQLKNMSDLKGNTVHKKNILVILNIATFVLIIGIITFLVSFFFSFGVEMQLTAIGIITATLAIIAIAIQDIRQDKIAHGLSIYFLGTFTLGIWPLIYSIKQTKKLKRDL